MSRIPSRQNFDNSIHQTSFGTYINEGIHTSEGTINNYQTIINSPTPSDLLHELHRRSSPSAAFDSRARFDPPRCTESTRLGIIRRIEEWIDTDDCGGVQASIFWLYGGAGVGKSALAQSLSEKFQAKKELAASFFFFRSDASRNDGEQLIPTLVSQLVNTFEGLDGFVGEGIRKSPHLFSKQYQVQMQELLVEPLRRLKSQKASDSRVVEPFPSTVTKDVQMQGSWPRLVVIDGLDECQNPDVQCELLRVIARAVPNIPYPLRFLITSRPESHITLFFDYDRDLRVGIIHRYNLSDDPDADADIWKFLETEFDEICRVHRLAKYLPRDWPGQKAISLLVERSSSHFIYASTVIRYIRSPKHRPDDRLKVILRLQPPQDQDRPYAQLDALYSFVLQSVEDPDQLEKVCLVLGILYFHSRKVGFFSCPTCSSQREIEGFLELKVGDLVLLLDPVISVISINEYGVQNFHKSLFDYLLDPSRGGHLPFDLARVHEVAATHILKTRIPNVIEHIPLCFAHHCRYGHLNNTLRGYLYSLEIPSGNPESWDIRSISRLMFDFFNILSREDFDSTGRYYKQYVAKWTNHLNSVIKGYPQLPSIDIEHVKGRLDTMLSEWKPRNPNLTIREIPSHAFRRIEDEHRTFVTFAKALTPPNQSNTVVSSLVFGEHFIHSYHVRYKLEQCQTDGAIFLILITYSSDNSFLRTWSCIHEIFCTTQGYLTEAERFFSSDFYQKYGIEPGPAGEDNYRTGTSSLFDDESQLC